MQHVVSAIVGTTARGLPRYSGCSCCSTDAKKLFRSMCRKPKRSGWDEVVIGEYEEIVFAFYLPTVGPVTNEMLAPAPPPLAGQREPAFFVVACSERAC